MAALHRIQRLRWWPPTANPVWLALGCRVAVYLAEQIPAEAWGRMLVHAVLV